MNFLAHFYLSHEQPDLLLGNFLADFTKGSLHKLPFDAEIIRGIQLHRAIDFFTDTHEQYKLSRKLFADKHRHYAGVIVDVLYDYLLSKHWKKYSTKPLAVFIDQTYSTLIANEHRLNAEHRKYVRMVVEHDWLRHYTTIAGIEKTFERMKKRVTFPNQLENAVAEFQLIEQSMDEHFLHFFPDVAAFSKTFLEE